MEDSLFAKIERPSGDSQVYTVSSLTDEIKILLEDVFKDVWVEGEISNFKVSPSGHAYFRLKDDKAVLDCVMWRTYLAGRKSLLRDGLMIRALGEISVYPPRGNYQFVTRLVRPAGKGALQERFDRLKASLHTEGLFDEARKKKIPERPRCIGVVTSPGGAAVRDFLRVLKVRFPHFRVVIAPVRVQGLEAPGEIAMAIDDLNAWGEADVIVLTRGGGSLEDLWAFNEEIVARAIYASNAPVVSAVGHEIDYTISDFVADLRAATPTAAAELFAQSGLALARDLLRTSERLADAVTSQIEYLRSFLLSMRENLHKWNPLSDVNIRRQRLDDLSAHLISLGLRRIEAKRAGLRLNADRFTHSARLAFQSRRNDLAILRERLTALDPMAVLRRGYSMTLSESTGRVVVRSDQVSEGEVLQTRLKEGSIRSAVVR